MMLGTLTRYFGWRFLTTVLAVFAGLMVLTAMIDFLEMMRRTSDIKDISTAVIGKVTLFRVPYLTERVMPFTVLVSTMFCYLTLSRRLELVIARSCGMSAWQFVAPAIFVALLLGVGATSLYNPLSAMLREESVRLEAQLFGNGVPSSSYAYGSGFWVRQKSDDGQAIINALSSNQQGVQLTGVTVFRFDQSDRYLERIDAKRAVLNDGFWRLEDAHVAAIGSPPADRASYDVKTNLTTAQVRESFVSPDTVPFWQLWSFIQLAENAGLAASGYRLQFYQLLAQPIYLASMVLLAAAVSLRLFRFGGVQKMVLAGIIAGFLLYVLSKICGDLSKAGMMSAPLAAGLPATLGGLTGLMTLLYQEDG
jgi:lipopolysaccharide export system permease protein